jgi:single-stranded DNA-binding protein
MIDINTITISGTIVGKVETAKKQDLSIARFQLVVLSSNDVTKPNQFKVVCFGDLAKFCEENLADGDPVIILGKLETNRLLRGQQETEIHPKMIIPIGKKEKEPELTVTEIE